MQEKARKCFKHLEIRGKSRQLEVEQYPFHMAQKEEGLGRPFRGASSYQRGVAGSVSAGDNPLIRT